MVKQSKPKQHNLEALRGAAALLVVIYHVIIHKQYLDPRYFPEWIKSIEPPGHFCVLVFFVLSGYVIGVSNPDSLTRDMIVPYLKKRLIRIYPIYFISLSIALLLDQPYPIKTVLGNYALLQGALADIVWANNPIWSLSQEAFFYLLFIPLSYSNVKPLYAAIAAVSVGLLNYLSYPAVDAPVISAYCYGFAFWATGWALAKYAKNIDRQVSYTRLLSGLFLVMAQPVLSTIYYLFDKFIVSRLHNTFQFPGSLNWTKTSIAFSDLASLPYCILLVASFAGLNFKYIKQFILVLQLLPLFTILQVAKHYTGYNSVSLMLFPILCFVVSISFYYVKLPRLEPFSQKIIEKGIKLGGISYGVYIIHFPILVLFGKVHVFSGNALFYYLRFLIYIIVALAAGYYLEKRIQLRIGEALKRKTLPGKIS